MVEKKDFMKLLYNPCINSMENIVIPININTPSQIIASVILMKYGLNAKIVAVILLFI